ncbi:hypothetical protein BH11MYX1_BH11MYX1_34710 [soil metagenome]
MLRHVVLALALVACKKTEPEAPPPPPAPTLPVVSNELAAQLGNFGFGLALDFTRLDRELLANLLPPTPVAMRSAVRSARLGVVTQTGDSWRAYITGVAEPDLRECLALFSPGSTFTTQGDTSMIGSGSDAGAVSATILELLHRVPADAVGWAASSGLPELEARTLVGWLETSATVWTFTVRVEAKDQVTANKIVDGFVERFAAALGHDGTIHIDRSWFTTSSTPTTATLVARVPLAALAPQQPAPR